MAVQPGAPADAADVWMRVLNEKRYWTKDNELHFKVFSNRALTAPAAGSAHTLELSGRLLSESKDVEQESKDLCKNRFFRGVIFQSVDKLRTDAAPLPDGC